MDAEKIRALRLADPFRPFELVMEDGTRFVIDQPYFLGIAPKGNLILVSTMDGGAEWFTPDRVRDAVFLASDGGTCGGAVSHGRPG